MRTPVPAVCACKGSLDFAQADIHACKVMSGTPFDMLADIIRVHMCFAA